MRIVKSALVGGTGYTKYLVEMPPEYRLMFVTAYGLYLLKQTEFYLPMPWVAYNVLAPTPTTESHEVYGCNVIAMYGLDEPYQDKCRGHYLPLPNQYGTGDEKVYSTEPFRFHNCSSSIRIDARLDVELQISTIIEYFWHSNFRYFMSIEKEYLSAFEWLGYEVGSRDSYGLGRTYSVLPSQSPPNKYERWENLSLDEVCTYPWGNLWLPRTVDYWFDKHSNTR